MAELGNQEMVARSCSVDLIDRTGLQMSWSGESRATMTPGAPANFCKGPTTYRFLDAIWLPGKGGGGG